MRWTTRLMLGTVVAALVSLHGGAAMAQSNSLLNTRLGNGGAAAQAAPDTEGPTDTTLTVRDSFPLERAAPKPNALLLRSSPFAVARPEPIKIKVHDLLTIIVRESKTATTDSKLQSKKNWKLDTGLEEWIRLSNKHGVVPAKFEQGKPSVLFDFKNDYKGNGKYDRKDELTTRITARVIDVKPNGNLVLEARKSIAIDDEGYTITLTGECRALDVLPDNTILSTQIADPTIDVQHSGSVRDATRRGWLMRGLDFLRPF
jgi:flagellar L-ring protein precursor FlgH